MAVKTQISTEHINETLILFHFNIKATHRPKLDYSLTQSKLSHPDPD